MTTPERRSQDVRREAQAREKPVAPQPSGTPAGMVLIVAALSGAGLIGWGVYLMYPPAAWVFAGAVIWLGAMRFARERKETRNATAKNG